MFNEDKELIVRASNGQFLKGFASWNKGKKYSCKNTENFFGRVPWNKGKGLSKQHKERISQSSLGKKLNGNQIKALADGRLAKKGKPSPSSKKLPQLFKSGKLHPRWRGGTKSWRGSDWKKTREEILERDGCCIECGSFTDLTVHHKIPWFWTKNNSHENLETLCRSCHFKKEIYFDKTNEYYTNHLEGVDYLIVPNMYSKVGVVKVYLDFNKKEEAEEKIKDAIKLVGIGD